MNNKDFLLEVATISKINGDEAQTCCDGILQTIENMLSEGEEVSIRGFGRFGVTKTYEHIVEKDGKKILMPPQLAVDYDSDSANDFEKEGANTASGSFNSLLAQRLSCSAEDAEILTFAFFKAIVNGLAKDKVVKVKGLGQFKINSSKGKDKEMVSSSSLFLSEALGFVTFTPDNSLKSAINKPFEHFQPVELKEGVQFDDLKEGEIKKERVSGEGPVVTPSSQPVAIVESAPEETQNVSATVVTNNGTTDTAPEVDTSVNEQKTVMDMSQSKHGMNWKWLVASLCAVAAIVALVLVLLPKQGDNSADLTVSSTDVPTDTATTAVAPVAKEDFTEANDRVRYGAYKIVGVDTAIILQQGQTLMTISATYFGGVEMEPYIKAINDGKSDFVAGDYVKIPKLEVK